MSDSEHDQHTPSSKRVHLSKEVLHHGGPRHFGARAPQSKRSKHGRDELVSLSSVSSHTNSSEERIKKLEQENMLLRTQLQKTPVPEEEDKAMVERVQRFTKQELFHRLKFITSQEELDNTTNKKSLGKYVMKELNIPEEIQQGWWLTYKEHVRKALIRQRNICMVGMKEMWMSKCKCHDCCSTIKCI